jgi:hypothetical protein
MAKATKKKAVAAKKKAVVVKATQKKAAGVKATKKKAVATKATKKTTESVVRHHVQALLARNLDELLKDYCEDSVLCSPMGTSKGLKSIRESFKAALGMLTPEAMANMKNIKQDVNGEYVYVIWSALPAVPFASDTFHIHDGKILMQTFVTPM